VQIAISPLAVFILTQSSPPVIFRLPYKRIVKHIAHEDMNIFTFWILKDTVQLHDIAQRLQQREVQEQGHGDGDGEVDEELGFDPNQFCDCIYLVTESVGEISFLFETYYKLCKEHVPPLLPGDVAEEEEEQEQVTGEGSAVAGSSQGNKNGINRLESFDSEMKRKGDEEGNSSRPRGGASRLNSFFQVTSRLLFAGQPPSPCLRLLLVEMSCRHQLRHHSL
jgi:hypothetical protein